MAVVKVPKTPKSAFDPGRRPSQLLVDQIKHLEWAALPASERKPGQIKKYRKPKTEAQAAERIAQLTKIVLHARLAPGEPGQPIVLPPLPPVAGRARKAKAKSARRAKKTKKKRRHSSRARSGR